MSGEATPEVSLGPDAEWLDTVFRMLGSPSIKKRESVVNEVLLPALQSESIEKTPEDLITLCRVMLLANIKYNTRKMRLLITRVVNFACSFDPIQKTFIMAFLETLGEMSILYLPSKKNPSPSFSLESYYLFFSLITPLLENYFNICKELKRDQWIIKSQLAVIAFLEAYGPNEKRSKSTASRSICKIFARTLRQSSDEHWKLYINLFQNDKKSLFCSTATGLLASACQYHDNELKEQFVEAFNKILLSPTPPVGLVLFSFRGFLSSLDESDVTKMLSVIKRAFARNAKAAALTGLTALQFMTINVDQELPGIYESVKPALKLDIEVILKETTKQLISFIQRVTDQSVIIATIKQITALAADRSLKETPKIYALSLLKKLVSFPECSLEVSVALVGVFKTSNSDKLKNATLSALTEWLKVAEQFPKAIVDLYATISQTTNRSVLLRSLSFVLTNRKIRAQAVSLFPTLLKIVSTPPKPVDRIDYMVALLCATELSSEESSFVEKLNSAAESFFTGPKSYLFAPEFQAKLSEEYHEIVALLCLVVLEERNFASSLIENIQPQLVLLLCSFAVKPKVQMQHIAVDYLIRASTVVPGIGKSLFSSIDDFLATAPSPRPSPRSFRNVICSVAKRVDIPLELLADLLLLISHPFVTPKQQDVAFLWGSMEIVQPIGRQLELYDSVSSAIIARSLKLDSHPLYQSASLRAAQFFVLEFPKSVNTFTSKCITNIQSSALQELSNRQIEIFQTPEGDLYDTSIATKKFQGRSKAETEKPNQKAQTTRASQQNSKKQQKRSGKGQGPTKEELEQQKIDKQLEVENRIRLAVAERVNQTITNFDLLTSVFQANGKLVTPEDFAKIYNLVLPLLNHVLVRVSVLQCHRTLSKCTSFSNVFGVKIGVLTQQIFDESSNKRQYSELAATLVPVISKLLTMAQNQPLDVSSFIYACPLIETALLRPTTFRVQQNAMSLFEIHAASSYPPGRPLAALLKAIDAKMMPDKAEACVVKYSECDLGYFPEELLNGCFSDSSAVRHACLRGLLELDALDDSSMASLSISTTLWFIQNDGIPENEKLAKEIWSTYEQPLFQDFSEFYKHFANPSLFVRETNARALAQIISQNHSALPELSSNTLDTLMNLYQEYLPPEPVVGVRGLEFAEDSAVIQRQGVSIALQEFYVSMQSSDVIRFFEFLSGSPLIDGDDIVRQRMIQAGIRVSEHFGELQHEVMLAHFERCLDDASHAVSGTLLREAIAIFLGSLAKKFDLGMEKTCLIVTRLIDSLETPSEQVQQTISECLSPLMKAIKAELPKFLELLFKKLQESKETYQRRGAAYGIAAVGKGLGVPGLSQLGIMEKLKELLENKRSVPAREGGLFAFECLSKRMKRGFEASAISKLDNLLACCGDSSPVVREAASVASREIMSQLSNHGVKRVVPALVKALSDRAWRTQTAAAELLGSMAFCAPKQLSACLPEIVPPLIESLASTHIEVQKCSKKALGHIASVVRNPEVQSHIPVLLKALDNPTIYLEDALEKLIKTNYVHVIDSPSLALLMPILQRGLQASRSTSSKKKAAQIIGNMTKLADHKDLVPYLEILLPALMGTLVDLIPETRSMSAAALGYLVKGLGEERFPDIVDKLYEQLRAPEGGIVHSGAAQGLAQVFSSLDIKRFETFLPSMLLNANAEEAHIRGGAISFFVFIPGAFGKRLEVYLPRILPAVLQGLADEAETVREASMRAGQAIILEFGSSSLDILLPLLEGGLFHSNYRIRLSSVTLLSDLLNKITGAEPDEEDGTIQDVSESAKILAKVLGEDKHDSVLSALYLTRSDIVRNVQQQALLTWKSAVHNTPATLRKILPLLLKRIINCLGSSNEDKRHAGSKTLGDLVQKLPDLILPTIVPIIVNGLKSDSVDTRLGVCLGLAEIVKSSRRHVLGSYLDHIIPSVRLALCDTEEEVREAATIAFDALFTAAGARVIDEILPKLLEEIHDNNSDTALLGLRDILGVRAKVILPHLVPYLLSEPITESKCNALASMAEVSGTHLYSHITMILNNLLPLLSTQPEVMNVLESLVVSVKKEGIHILLSDVLKFSKSSEPIYKQQGAAEMIYILASKSSTDYTMFTSQLIYELLDNFNHHNTEITAISLKALDTLIKKIPKENLPNYIPELNRQLRNFLNSFAQEVSDVAWKYLPGFSLPKGLSPLLTMTLQGLRFGNPNIRETSAVCLGQMIQLTDPSCMKPYVALIAGPLIRVMGDRFSEIVKAAILKTMGILLDNCGQFCKPFVNQLQTTFIRSLNDPSEKVRASGALNLGKLMIVSSRIDQLVTELLNTFLTSDNERKGTLLAALSNVLATSGDRVSEKTLLSCEDKCTAFLLDIGVHRDIISSVGDVLALTFKYLPEGRFDEAKFFSLLVGMSDAVVQSSVLICLLRNCIERLLVHQAGVLKLLKSFVSSKDEKVRFNCAVAISLISESDSVLWSANEKVLLAHWVVLLSDPVSTNKLQALEALKGFAKRSPGKCEVYLSSLVPILMERVKDRSSLPVKLAAERTLFYVLQVNTDSSVLTNYANKVGAAQARPVQDYCKRVLSKLTADDVE